MHCLNYELQSEFMRRIWNEAREQGREQARAESLVRALLLVLETRHLAVDEAQRARIAACLDAEVLEGWLQQAVTAISTDAVLG